MTDLIKEIFYREEEDGTLEYRDIPGYLLANDRLNTYHRKVELGFDAAFVDQLAAAEADINAIETLAAFRHGFRLAGRLLLEMLNSRQ